MTEGGVECYVVLALRPGGHVRHATDFIIFLVQPSLARNHCFADDILVRLAGNSGGPKIPANHQDPVRSHHGPAHRRPIYHLVRTRKDLVWAGFEALSSREIRGGDAHYPRARHDDPHDHRSDERQFGDPDYFHLSGNVRFKISGMTVTSSNLP